MGTRGRETTLLTDVSTKFIGHGLLSQVTGDEQSIDKDTESRNHAMDESVDQVYMIRSSNLQPGPGLCLEYEEHSQSRSQPRII